MLPMGGARARVFVGPGAHAREGPDAQSGQAQRRANGADAHRHPRRGGRPAAEELRGLHVSFAGLRRSGFVSCRRNVGPMLLECEMRVIGRSMRKTWMLAAIVAVVEIVLVIIVAEIVVGVV
eukprot:6453769-Pyramimonas_sp.AAC.1